MAAKRRKPTRAAAERARQQRLAKQQRVREEKRARKARSERATRGWVTRRGREQERERQRAEAAAKRKRSRAAKKGAAKRPRVEPSALSPAQAGKTWGTWIPRAGGGGEIVYPPPPPIQKPGRGPKGMLRALVVRAGIEATAARFGVVPRTIARWLAIGAKIPDARKDQIRGAAARSDRALLAAATRNAKRTLLERAKRARFGDLHGVTDIRYDDERQIVLALGADGQVYQLQTLVSADGTQYDQWDLHIKLAGFQQEIPPSEPGNINFAYATRLGKTGSSIQIFYPVRHGKEAA